MANGFILTQSTGNQMYKLTIIILLLLPVCTTAQNLSHTDTTTEYTIRGTFYHDRFIGRKTSSGEVFRQDLYTAAHRHIKFGTILLVTNPKNGKQVMVKINDRCPTDRILDMTRLAASTIGIKSSTVIIRVLPPHYKELWEQQDKLTDVLSEGRLLEFSTHYFAGHKQFIKEAKNDNNPTIDNHPILFDIELMRGHSLTGDNTLKHIPFPYQDKIGIRNIPGSTEKKMVLFLSLPRLEATKILTSFLTTFPNATLISAEQSILY